MIETVCVFCGSSLGKNPAYQEAAYALGKQIAQRGQRLVYGGGSYGLMGIVADAALAHKGYVIGIMPRGLVRREAKHLELSEIHMVDSMHERKALMSEFADAYITMPGGYGTFEELMEVTTWAQLGIHRKALVLFNVADYYAPLLAMIRRGIDDGFILPDSVSLLQVANHVDEVFDLLDKFQPSRLRPRWMSEDQI